MADSTISRFMPKDALYSFRGAAAASDDSKHATLKAIYDTRKFVFTPGAVYDFCMVAQKGKVEVTSVDVELTDSTNHPVDARLLDVSPLFSQVV